jgi:lysophospholipid acyltransferase (LPLAT)-like uncharacterized protein
VPAIDGEIIAAIVASFGHLEARGAAIHETQGDCGTTG